MQAGRLADLDRQLALECEMLQIGADAFASRMNKRREQGMESLSTHCPPGACPGNSSHYLIIMRDLSELAAMFCGLVIAICLPVAGIVATDYFISAESTVNAINAQCGTQYKKLDYLRIGQDAMLQMCETRQKRIELR
jgi:hypothetical protein